MKQPINLILGLMAGCVLGIIGLQLYWNYQNYRRTVATFRHDSNEALRVAVEQEINQRRQLLIAQTKRWLADTSFIRITCRIDPRYGRTVFNINDRYPKVVGSQGLSFSMRDFTPKLSRITPQAKQLVIDHVGDNILRKDLTDGSIYFYTQRLGDSLVVAFEKSHRQLPALAALYRRALASRDIHSPFVLNPTDTLTAGLMTDWVNTAFRRPYTRELVRARLSSPGQYFFASMKWLLLSTGLLIGVCLFCFGYTAKTLLSQHKLAALKQDFINNMTHEFNTPLASIKITTEALKTFAYDSATRQEYLGIIDYQTEKLTDLTGRILSVNRLAAPARSAWQPVDVCQLLSRALSEMALRLDHEGATVRYQPTATSLLVNGEASSLVTVFTNLLDNALKYAPDGLRLDIDLRAHQRWVEICFADNGMGIPAEYRTQVFEPFFRVPQGNRHAVKGHGLGLSYVRQVLVQHRGSVQVVANQPVGSQFILNLPLC